ncbi:hypothetical protein HK096_002824, partial [Nowakowskiella sp. JEL0078]
MDDLSPPRKTMTVPSPSSGKLRKIQLQIINGVPVDPTGMYGFPEFIYADSELDEDYMEGNSKSKSSKKNERLNLHENKISEDETDPTPYSIAKKRGRPPKQRQHEASHEKQDKQSRTGEWQNKQINAYEKFRNNVEKQENIPKKQREKLKSKVCSSSAAENDMSPLKTIHQDINSLKKMPSSENSSPFLSLSTLSLSESLSDISSDNEVFDLQNPLINDLECKSDIVSSTCYDSSDDENNQKLTSTSVQKALERERKRSAKRSSRKQFHSISNSDSDNENKKGRSGRQKKNSSYTIVLGSGSRKKPIPSDKVNYADRSGRTAIFKFAQSGDVDSCSVLITSGADLHHQDYAGWTPLHVACLAGRLDVVRLLLMYGADVNCAGGDLDTPLHDAVSNRHIEVITELLKHGASIFAKNAHGRSPLDVAKSLHIQDEADLNVLEMLQKWEDMRKKVCERDAEGLTTLHRAAILGQSDVIKEYLSFGAGVDTRDNFGWRPLHEAASHGFFDIVELLLQHGADVNDGPKVSGVIKSPLLDAVHGCWADVVQILVDYGASVFESNEVWKILQELELEASQLKMNKTEDAIPDNDVLQEIERIRRILNETKEQEKNGTKIKIQPLFRPQMILPCIMNTINSRSQSNSLDQDFISQPRQNSVSGISDTSFPKIIFEDDSISTNSTNSKPINIKQKTSTISKNGEGSMTGGAGVPNTSINFSYHLQHQPHYATITSRNEYFAWGGLLPRDGQEFESTREERKFKATLKRLQLEQRERSNAHGFMSDIEVEKQHRIEFKDLQKQVRRFQNHSVGVDLDDWKLTHNSDEKDLDSGGEVPIKRKRGRPRKHPIPDDQRLSVSSMSQSPVQSEPAFLTCEKTSYDKQNLNTESQRNSEHSNSEKVSMTIILEDDVTDAEKSKKPRGRPPKR